MGKLISPCANLSFDRFILRIIGNWQGNCGDACEIVTLKDPAPWSMLPVQCLVYNPTEKTNAFDTWGMVCIKKYIRMRVPKRYSLDFRQVTV